MELGKSRLVDAVNTSEPRHPREGGGPEGGEVRPADTLDSRLRGNDGDAIAESTNG